MPTEEGSIIIHEKKDLRRRSFLTSAILSLFWGTVAGSARSTNAVTSDVTEEELMPFRKIAKDKGVTLVFRKDKKERVSSLSEMHLDMDMVRASLQNAIARAKKQKLYPIQERLERLLADGTAAQKVDFVLGSGDRYIFPEDLERVAAMAEQNKFYTFKVDVCGKFCWLACSCTGKYEQACRERCREIFCPEKG